MVFNAFFSYPGVVEFKIAEMACVSSNVRRTFHVPSGVRVQRSISGRDVSHPRVEPLIAFSHILELNSGSQDWRPLPDMSARLVPSPLRYISPVIQSWSFALVSYNIGANNLENFCLNLFQRSCFSKYFSLAMVQFFRSFTNSSSTFLANCSL